MDMIITFITIGAFAFIVWRKHKQKKTESAKVQTSELCTPSVIDSSVLSSFGNGAMTPYPTDEQGGFCFRTVNFRSFHTSYELESAVETAVVNMREKAILKEKTAFFQYIPIGTTLLIVCVYM